MMVGSGVVRDVVGMGLGGSTVGARTEFAPPLTLGGRSESLPGSERGFFLMDQFLRIGQ
jgi:hypothetical protein